MIISASRRTDIPAFYSDWFMNRIREGFCIVPNPFSMSPARVSLQPEDVEAIVFWSKDPRPLLRYLDELDQRGFRYYFQFTLNDYPQVIEPGLLPLSERLATFHELAQRLGPSRVVWRYDPIIVSNVTPADYHREVFARIAAALSGATRRVMVSFCDFYQKTERRLGELENEGYRFDRQAALSVDGKALLRDMASIAQDHGMEIFSCAQELDYNDCGVGPGMCVDAHLLEEVWSITTCLDKDPNQRQHCRCVVSKDIGVNDTCMHGCLYCYSTRSAAVATQRHLEHLPDSPAIWGKGVTSTTPRLLSAPLGATSGPSPGNPTKPHSPLVPDRPQAHHLAPDAIEERLALSPGQPEEDP